MSPLLRVTQCEHRSRLGGSYTDLAAVVAHEKAWKPPGTVFQITGCTEQGQNGALGMGALAQHCSAWGAMVRAAV